MPRRAKNEPPANLLGFVKAVTDLMVQGGLLELEIERSGLRLRLKRGVAVPVGETQATVPTPAVELERAKCVQITSPFIGTFYRAPAPDAEPFVEVGQDIRVGDSLCIVEAMKVMNILNSEVAGRVVEVLVENNAPVEFGQPLFLVRPSSLVNQ